MKHVITSHEARQHGEHGVSTFTEYTIPSQRLSTGVSRINGRYPQTGMDADTGVEATWYVVSGEGRVCISGSEYTVSEGDLIYVPKNAPFWIDGRRLVLVVTSTPSWTSEQHTHITEG